MKIVAIIQARMTSSRLPGKILMNVQEKSLLEINLYRIGKSKKIDKVILATTSLASDDKTQSLSESFGVDVFRGDENDVLDRFYQAVKQKLDYIPEYIVRLTADCPLIDAELIDKIIEETVSNNLDYCSNTLEPTYPDGQDVEVFKFSCLEKAWNEAKLQSEREHVTPYIWKNSTIKGANLFTSKSFSDTDVDYSALRMTVDEIVDFELIKHIITNLGIEKSWNEYAEYLNNNTQLKAINKTVIRNQGYENSINKEK